MGNNGFTLRALGWSHQSRCQCSLQRQGLTRDYIASGEGRYSHCCWPGSGGILLVRHLHVAASVKAGFTVFIKSVQRSLGGIRTVCAVTPTSAQLIPRGWD